LKKVSLILLKILRMNLFGFTIPINQLWSLRISLKAFTSFLKADLLKMGK